MMLNFSNHRSESWEETRARMIRETEVFLEAALRRPEDEVRIPSVPVGRGGFLPEFAEAFWRKLLGD